MSTTPSLDARFDALIVGGGHNGLVCAAYLAQSGMKVLVIEARSEVGGTAASESYAGVTVNICNCDHLTFRTAGISDDLGLDRHGLRYIDIDPTQLATSWSDRRVWPMFHDLDRQLEVIKHFFPNEVEGYRSYAKAAMPVVELILEAGSQPPTRRSLVGKVLAKRGRGATTMLKWSKLSSAQVLRQFFSSELLIAPSLVTGPTVWGVSPHTPGTGLGALVYAMRHVAKVGRPVGGSGMVPITLRRSIESNGGVVATSTLVSGILCEGDAVRGVELTDGRIIEAPLVVSACNPHDTFLKWLRNAPACAQPLVEKWRNTPHYEGYESKIDARITRKPVLRDIDEETLRNLGADPLAATMVVAPTTEELHEGFGKIATGEILDRPAMLVNLPSIADPTMSNGVDEVFSLEALFTPYSFRGGWASDAEPRRWLELYADLVEPGFLESIAEWRCMTPAKYESEFFLPQGHATSFAGGPLAALLNTNPELTRYATPVKGLYLTGAATFPGAGVWGASGKNAALTILRR
ncbi:MAG: NAD(P)/FAD-dependent oxidoreductase [Actinobacteria bacterium]|nr:NAD(P)/FAD-dependent oxidoreductase [Actinomycetota bacterium]NBP53997.1 NAD(P)/FAD-dependent oxidoreductase [Actinomycetota bacterium]